MEKNELQKLLTTDGKYGRVFKVGSIVKHKNRLI